ncbi:MAG: ABC transporter permease [Methylococcales bacterium]
MLADDVLRQSVKSVGAQPLRSFLILIAMAIGVAAVILLTALGDSARRYIMEEFASLGSNLLIVLPGRSETVGGAPPIFGETPRDLTLDDAVALLRSQNIRRIAPITVGSAPVSWRGLEREVNILGSTSDLKDVRHLDVSQGRFLPVIDPQKASPVCVIGQQLRTELFGGQQALGQWLRIGDRRFRVIGILASEGQSIGVDFDDIVIIPVASAQILFDSPALFRVLAEAVTRESMLRGVDDIQSIIKARHEGEDDVTIITQDAVVKTFDTILNALTLTVAGIAGISLAVAGILIMNVMLVSVAQRTTEIGLLKAIGATPLQIQHLFLIEAALLSLSGAIVGLLLGQGAIVILRQLYPVFPISAPLWALITAVVIALFTGIISGILPAIRASRLDPVQALSRR